MRGAKATTDTAAGNIKPLLSTNLRSAAKVQTEMNGTPMNALTTHSTASPTGFRADAGSTSAPPVFADAHKQLSAPTGDGASDEGSGRSDARLPGGMRDRRQGGRSTGSRRSSGRWTGRAERRQFGDAHNGLSEAGRELAAAIDGYKMRHHRRYITCDEMLNVLCELGYTKQSV